MKIKKLWVYLPIFTGLWVLFMLLSLRFGWLDAFFWGAEHANVQGIDYFALPKSFLNLLEHRSLYDSWQGKAFGPYATWYLAHPLFSVLVMPGFAFFPTWVSYALFVVFSLLLMVYCGAILAKKATSSEGKSIYYALFLCSFPLYWMLYVGNMHAFLVLSLTLILSALYDLAYSNTQNSLCQRQLLAGLLLSLFTKPLVILCAPILLSAKETRKTMLIAAFIYAAVSILVLSSSWINPESVGWAKRLGVMFDVSTIKNTMNIYQNHFVLNSDMKDNGIHWFNLIAQSGYRFNHIDNFSFPVFFDALFEHHYPDALYLLPLILPLIFSIGLLWVKAKEERLKLLLLLVMLSSTSFFLSYNTVWEYQYTSMMPVVAVLFALKDKSLFSKKQKLGLMLASVFYYLPSFYFLLDQTHIDTTFLCMVRVSREVPTLVLFFILSKVIVMRMKQVLIFTTRSMSKNVLN